MKVTVEVYGSCKYLWGAEVVCEAEYDVESFSVQEWSDDEVRDQGFDEFDPFGEYLELKLTDGGTATFRNSYVDMFKF